MKRVLLMGMSGVGKSTVVEELGARGFKAIDIDQPGWSEYAADGKWVWREDKVRELLATEDADCLFVSGCAENQVKFYADFDHILLLSAPTDVIIERVTARSNNNFGKRPEELTKILGDIQRVEPILRRVAHREIDTSQPLDRVVSVILDVVGER